MGSHLHPPRKTNIPSIHPSCPPAQPPAAPLCVQVDSLEMTLKSPSLPPEVLNKLLNLVEFMELRDRPLPIGTPPLLPSFHIARHIQL